MSKTSKAKKDNVKRLPSSPDDRASAREMQYGYNRSDRAVRREALCLRMGDAKRGVFTNRYNPLRGQRVGRGSRKPEIKQAA